MSLIGKPKIIIDNVKIYSTFILSIIFSLIISLTYNSYNYIFYIYSLLIIGLIVLQHFKIILIKYILFIKISLDLLLTSFIVISYIYLFNNTFFYFIPLLMLSIYGKINIYSNQNKIINKIFIIYIIFHSIIPFSIIPFNNIGVIGLISYIILGFIVVWLILIEENSIITYEENIQTLINKIAIHDLNNALSSLSTIIYLMKKKSKINVLKYLSSILKKIKNVSQLLLGGREKIFFKPHKIIMYLHLKNVKILIPSDYEIYGSIPLFISIVNNLYENSKRYSKNNKFLFTIYLKNDYICFEDNCKGYLSLNKIKKKYTTKKGFGHGEFLYSLFFKSKNYGIKTKLENKNTGVIIKIKYEKELKYNIIDKELIYEDNS